jgi:flagellar motor switch protein FliN/FliY
MSDGSLSQDEIDALLQGTDSIEMDLAPDGAGLSEQEISIFQNILREVVGSQSSNLSMLIGKSVRIENPQVEVASFESLSGLLKDEVVEVKIDLTDGLQGDHLYLLSTDAAERIASPMIGQEKIELDDMALSTIGEAISNITGPVVTAIGNKINKTVQHSPPISKKVKKNEISLPLADFFVKVEFPFTIEGDVPMSLIEIYNLNLVKEITSLLSGGAQPAAQPAAATGATSGRAASSGSQGSSMGNAGAQQTFGQPLDQGGFGDISMTPNVQPVQFANLQSANVHEEQSNIGLLMDVYMEMTVELGRTKKLIKDILTIGEGTIIELDKLAGEPVDILVNHKLIAKGEVVVIDENFGVRVTEIVSPLERMGDLT